MDWPKNPPHCLKSHTPHTRHTPVCSSSALLSDAAVLPWIRQASFARRWSLVTTQLKTHCVWWRIRRQPWLAGWLVVCCVVLWRTKTARTHPAGPNPRSIASSSNRAAFHRACVALVASRSCTPIRHWPCRRFASIGGREAARTRSACVGHLLSMPSNIATLTNTLLTPPLQPPHQKHSAYTPPSSS